MQNSFTPAHFKTSISSKIPCAAFCQKCRKNGHFSRKIPDFRCFSGSEMSSQGRKLRARGPFFRDFFPGCPGKSRISGVKRPPRRGKPPKNTIFSGMSAIQGPDLGPGPGTPDLGGPNERFTLLRPPFLGIILRFFGIWSVGDKIAEIVVHDHRSFLRKFSAHFLKHQFW